MPCMCGDIYCPSCGPAQGNHRCPNCGAWSADGGCENPSVCARANKEADEAEFRYYMEMKYAHEEWVTALRRTEDPKLSWFEKLLDKHSIAHRRRGHSFHAPILEVPKRFEIETWALLGKIMPDGRVLDDIPDDDPIFGEENEGD